MDWSVIMPTFGFFPFHVSSSHTPISISWSRFPFRLLVLRFASGATQVKMRAKERSR